MQGKHSSPPTTPMPDHSLSKNLFGKTQPSGFIAQGDMIRYGNEVENAFDQIRSLSQLAPVNAQNPILMQKDKFCSCRVLHNPAKMHFKYLMWLQLPCVPFGKKKKRKETSLDQKSTSHIIISQSLPSVGSLSSAREKEILCHWNTWAKAFLGILNEIVFSPSAIWLQTTANNTLPPAKPHLSKHQGISDSGKGVRAAPAFPGNSRQLGNWGK